MIYLDLFLGFLYVGCFSFGGAYGAIPLIRDVVLSHGWISDETLACMIAVSESTPGPIMVNLATYVGSSRAGMAGAAIATAAVVLPSFAVTILVTAALRPLLGNRYVQAVLNGVKPCVVGIILATGADMALKNCVRFGAGISISPDARAVWITALLVAVMAGVKKLTKKKLSPVALIFLSALAGILIYG